MTTDYRSRLAGLIDDFLHDRLTFADFQKRYSDCFIEEMPGDALSSSELEAFGTVHEKAETTALTPSKEDRKYGWLDPAQFRDWLREHRASLTQ